MKLKAPNVFVLMCAILVLVGALTWIVPGGEFDRAYEHGRVVVVPGSYEQIEAVPQGPFDLLMSPIRGFHDSKNAPEKQLKTLRKRAENGEAIDIEDVVVDKMRDASHVAGFILLIGGAFGVLAATGALMAGLGWITQRSRGAGRFAMIPILMTLFSLGGATFGMSEETLVFVMITVPLAVAMGFDVITGVAIPMVGAHAGFAAAFINPFTLGVAKKIAEQDFGVGQGYRIFCWFAVTGICIAFVLWHAWRVSKNPARSPTAALDEEWRQSWSERTDQVTEFTRLHGWVLLLFGAAMAVLVYGSIQLEWYIDEIAGLFLGMALVCGLVGRMSLGKIAQAFMQGVKDLAPTAVLVAFARAIFIVADDGKIIDTMLNFAAGNLEGAGTFGGTQAMFAVQTGINLFVVSGSGQAALTMPVMVPLADLLEIHRENAILAFQFGDGFTNMIVPTSPVLMGVISLARLPYGTWFRWILPFQLVLFALGATLLWLSPFGAS